MPSATEAASNGDTVDGSVISDAVATVPTGLGGRKRPQDEHAVMEYDGEELEHKTQKISSIFFGIGSEDIVGEMSPPSSMTKNCKRWRVSTRRLWKTVAVSYIYERRGRATKT